MYHVTKVEHAESIWNNGLSKGSVQGSWAETRDKMRRDIDVVGEETHSDWVNRSSAVYLWPTYKKASRYAGRYTEPAIVEITQPNKTVWSLPNQMIEDLFRSLSNNGVASEDQIQTIVDHAQKWNGERDNNLELWVKAPISANNIRRITDYSGNPLQFE